MTVAAMDIRWPLHVDIFIRTVAYFSSPNACGGGPHGKYFAKFKLLRVYFTFYNCFRHVPCIFVP